MYMVKIPIFIIVHNQYEILKKTVESYEKYIKTNELNSLPAWIFLNNQEIRISSTEIRKQRKILRGKN